MAKTLMIQGTMSGAGKSLLTAGLLRILKQDGWRAAPFKSQNMALNSYITKDGLEMGRAQAVQAEAAMTEPSADMNPILLKPVSDMGSQVIVRGVPMGNMPARDYFRFKQKLVPEILAAFRRLEADYDMIVIEGAGSPAEINLKQNDIVNMGLAQMLDAPVLLVGDIDRGGVFAQLYGTVMLLEPEERARIRGLIINKFRGDPAILDPGIGMIEKLCGIPVIGVTPYMQVDLEDEDSLTERFSGNRTRMSGRGTPDGGDPDAVPVLDIAVIRLPRISNFTDFQALSCMPEVGLRYVTRASQLGTPDLILLPGTKNTIDDLLWMRECGLETAVLKRAAAGTPVFGICGGYQMMGMTLLDAEGVESAGGQTPVRGMELLPADTVYTAEKVRSQVTGAFGHAAGVFSGLTGKVIEGYEIHMGVTRAREGRLPLLYLEQKKPSGGKGVPLPLKKEGISDGNCCGTCVHGIFDAPGVADGLVEGLLAAKGLTRGQVRTFDYKKYKEEQYDRLADQLRRHLDLDAVYAAMGLTRPGKTGGD